MSAFEAARIVTGPRPTRPQRQPIETEPRPTVRERFTEVSNALATGVTGGSITVGFAEPDNGDSPEDLIRRADHDLLAHRENS
jgi:hypothetical protein